MSKKLYVPKGRYSYEHLHNHVKTKRLRKKYHRDVILAFPDCCGLADCYIVNQRTKVTLEKLSAIWGLTQKLEKYILKNR